MKIADETKVGEESDCEEFDADVEVGQSNGPGQAAPPTLAWQP